MNPDKDIFFDDPFFDALFKQTKENCILLMNSEGIVVAINDAFTKCFGYAEKDIVGQTIKFLFTEEDQKKGKPERELREVLHRGQSNDNNYLVNKNGELTWVSGESVLVKSPAGEDLILKVIQNIHLQKTREISLRELNTFSENILESIKDGVIVLDDQLKIVKANYAFLTTFNLQDQDLFSFDFTSFISQSESGVRIIENLHTVSKTHSGFSNKHVEIKGPAGDTRIFELTCSTFINDAANHILLIFHDVTVYKELEKEREDIIGFVTHELRNPLSNVLLLNEIMREAVNEKNLSLLSEMIHRSEKNAARMNKMLGELYTTTKVSSGQFSLELSRFRFIDMIKEAVETVQVLHPTYEIIVEGDGDFNIVADRHRIIQVVTNYLSNAIKYSNGNKKVVLSIFQSDNMATVSVKDKGWGISKEHLPYLFERFFRIEKTRNIEGIGLGLYLCRQIIRAHKGYVWVESEIGEGSTFFFSIPLNNQ